MWEHIWIYGINILYLTCTPLLFGAFMEGKPRWSVPTRISLFIGASVFFTFSLYVILDFFRADTLLRMALLLTRTAACLWVISLPYRGSMLRRLFSVLMIVMIFTLSEQIAIVLFAVLYNSTPGIVSQKAGYAYAIQGVSDVLAYTSIVLIGLLRRKQQKAQTSSKIYILVSIIPSVSVVFSGAFFFSNDYMQISNPGTTMQIWAFIVVINLLTYLLFNTLEETYAQNQALVLEQQYYHLREEYYQKMEDHQKEIRMIKHDLKNQLLASPLELVIERLSQQTKYDFTAHSGVNAVLCAKYQLALQENVICEFEARLPEDIQIAAVDLTVLTGNILDNAIEACRYCDSRRYIRFRCIYVNGSLVVSSENSTDGKVNSLKTRKGDSFNHGLGIESIKAIVEKYNGEMQYHFRSCYFTLSLTLFEEQVVK